MKITKEWLIQEYIVKNKPQKQIAKENNISLYIVGKKISEFDIIKPKELILKLKKQTSLKRFGTEFASQNENVKLKVKTTNFNKYGVENPFQSEEVKAQIKKTNIQKYGVESPIQNKEIKEQIRKTNLKKYGVEYYSQFTDYNEKYKNTCLKRWNTTNPSKLNIIKQKAKQTGQNNGTISDVFGRSILEWTREYNLPQMSLYCWLGKNTNITKDELIYFLENYKRKLTDIENIISNVLNLEKWNKKFHQKLNYKPDFKLSDHVALNVDGLYWHSELCKDDKYHFKMRKDYEQLGLRIIQFRSDEVFGKINIIKSIINDSLNKSKITIDIKKTEIAKINNKKAQLFLEQNHIKGYKNTNHLGVYYQNELVSIMSYKSQKAVQHIIIERFCFKNNYYVAGAFSKFLKLIQNQYSNRCTFQYWADLRYEVVDWLLKEGFREKKETLNWEWTDLTQTYEQFECSAKLSEEEYTTELKWHKIYGAGQRLFVK